jgi:uncharacterized coiled-coil protein SlyX
MRRGAHIAIAVLLATSLGACGASSPAASKASAKDAASSDQTGSGQEAVPLVEAAAAPETVPGAPPPGGSTPETPRVPDPTKPSATAGRKIVRTGNIQITSKDVVGAGPQAQAIIEGFGGYVATQQSSYGTDPTVTMTFRLPSASFDQAMSALSKVGVLVQASVNSEEVTAQAIDLDARLRTARAGRDRLLELMKGAQNNQALADLETQLVQRESDIESMQAQLNTINDRVSLSTITMSIGRTAVALPDSGKKPTFTGGLSGGWKAMKAIGSLIAALGGVLIGLSPLIAMGLVTIWGIRLLSRRRRLRLAKLAPPNSGGTSMGVGGPGVYQVSPGYPGQQPWPYNVGQTPATAMRPQEMRPQEMPPAEIPIDPALADSVT